MKSIYKTFFAAIALSTAALNASPVDNNYEQKEFREIATKLENEFWAQVQDHNWHDVGSSLADCFQAGYSNGQVLTKEAEIALLQKLNLSNYGMEQPTITHAKNLLIISYIFKGTEMINGKTSAAGSLRTSVWRQEKNVWKMVSHSNFAPL